MEIFGVMGVIELLSGWFIILVTERELIGKIGDHEIYKVKKTSIQEIPNHVQLNEEEVFNLFTEKNFFFRKLNNSTSSPNIFL